MALSLEDAVARGLKQNLGGVLATDLVTDARGERRANRRVDIVVVSASNSSVAKPPNAELLRP